MKLHRMSALVAVGVLSVLAVGRLTWSAVTVSDAQVPPGFEEVPAVPDSPGGSPYLPDGPSYLPEGPGCGDACGLECCGPSYWMHRGGFFGEFLYLRARDSEVAYAVPIDGPISPNLGNGVQIGETAIVDPESESGFRVGYVKCLDERSSLSIRYTDFESETSDLVSINAPDVIRSLVTHPLGQNAATDVLDAGATYGVDFQLVDLDFRAVLECGDNYVINYMIGARYGHLDQNFRSLFDTSGNTFVGTDIEFDGGGIRLGLDGERQTCFGGIFLYGRSEASFLAGEFHADYLQGDSFDPVIARTSWDSGRIVSILDLELGLGWTGPSNNWRFTAGYQFSAWLNTVKTDEFIAAVQSNDFEDLGDSLTFDGFTCRLEFRL